MVKKRRIIADGKLRFKPSRRRKIEILALLLGLVLIVGAAGIYAWQQPVVAEVTYEPCEISYGDVVADWDGNNKNKWNQEGYHYQVRSFRVFAQSPGNLRPQVIEANPTRISTGGKHACGNEFNERIDTFESEYRYQGAVADAVRIGYPKSSSVRTSLTFNTAQASSEGLDTPVMSDSHNSAAAWVDDGASGEVFLGEEKPQQIYCVNYGDCGDITAQGGEEAIRGEGFVFVEDNCTGAVDCSQEWYGESDITDTTEPGLVGIEPFRLRLSAVSTYAPVVGTEVLLTFAYPRFPEPRLDITKPEAEFTHNQKITINGEITKPGTGVETGRIEFGIDGHPIAGEAVYRLSEKELARLNDSGVFRFKQVNLRTTTVEKRSCHEMPVEVILGNDGKEFKSGESYKYCVSPPGQRHTYSVSTRGNITSDLNQFRNLAAETLKDYRGWSRAGIEFIRVDSGGDFTLWLSSPAQMTSFSPHCSPEYSCRVGRDVIINDDPWQNATPAWNDSGGSLRDYRHMVINHEVGHFLGLGHYGCPSAGALAPVMQQQSIDLAGCRFNPWPRSMEISQL